MSKILIIRFSALGDVAMTIPVLYSLAKAYPNDTITILTKINFKPLFENLNNNILVWGVDLKNQYKGIWGLEQLYQELKTEQFDYIADFHSVLRSKYICRRFDLSQVPTTSIDKGRAEKKKLTRKNNKNFISLKSTFIRYYEVLEKLGFKFELNFHSIFANNEPDFSYHISEIGEKKDTKWLGIAPFAKHK
jgi:ADP-heptose:LPS heptosyltransferase